MFLFSPKYLTMSIHKLLTVIFLFSCVQLFAQETNMKKNVSDDNYTQAKKSNSNIQSKLSQRNNNKVIENLKEKVRNIDSIQRTKQKTTFLNKTLSKKGRERTYIPDDGFESHLIDLGYDDVMDNYVFTSAIDTIQNLYLTSYPSHLPLTSLTGIEDFSNLKTLFIDIFSSLDTHFTSLSLSSNTLLENLHIESDYVKEINIEQNIKLKHLYLSKCNKLEKVDVPKNTSSLVEFTIRGAQNLTEVKLPLYSDLTDIEIAGTKINQLELPNNDKINLYLLIIIESKI